MSESKKKLIECNCNALFCKKEHTKSTRRCGKAEFVVTLTDDVDGEEFRVRTCRACAGHQVNHFAKNVLSDDRCCGEMEVKVVRL